ncbi:MAG: peptide deformylase, partial [bacterium]|nr:peptide deformylase [bacterium]
VLKPSDKILRHECKPVTRREIHTNKLQAVIEQMLGIVYGQSNKGENRNINKPMTVGLSANQIGIDKRISIVDLAISKKAYNDIHVLINPEIIWRSKSLQEKLEGCVNLPKIWGYVNRSKRVIIRAFDRSGNKIQIDASGLAAKLLQHEIDHLNGILFIDHLKDPKKAHRVLDKETRAHKKAGKSWSKFIDVTKLVKKIK